ncbi:MAG: hypothetical protein RBR77_12150 [Thauera sp.]|jgi:hypothetical protein|nr:hypothetical protein [Thauera sp.]
MKKLLQTSFAVIATALLTGSAAAATEFSCPALESAVQVAPCPTEAELRHTYTGFCSDNARLYGRDILLCANYEDYRAEKNIALWESADARFSGYLSCNDSAESIRASAALRMHQDRPKGVTRVMCDYENDHRLEYRSREQCRIEVENCKDGACRTVCE